MKLFLIFFIFLCSLSILQADPFSSEMKDRGNQISRSPTYCGYLQFDKIKFAIIKIGAAEKHYQEGDFFQNRKIISISSNHLIYSFQGKHLQLTRMTPDK